ncbi:uncharacterized protein LOC129926779 [Biomphalaria glabrata]|uniref:Uncharacterized protein LOC129926779 n=1 Tax=Biomphalaria glabrata TaxID=6526 RepID=A0A9W3AN45_BIOGL|nr:uncharacterized protein LOC129926779 [Biomphalaria glabrata]
MRSLILVVLVAAIGFVAAEWSGFSYVIGDIPECLETFFEREEKFLKFLVDLCSHAEKVFGAETVMEIIKKALEIVFAKLDIIGGDLWNSQTNVEGLASTATTIISWGEKADLPYIEIQLEDLLR